MDLNDLLNQLQSLNLPSDQFAVFGSGPLGVRGLRPINDLDLIVTAELWEVLAERYSVISHDHGLKKIQIGDIEILDGWYPEVSSVEQLIAEADVFDGVRFVRLHSVLEWKRLRGNPCKDPVDITLIEAFLSESESTPAPKRT